MSLSPGRKAGPAWRVTPTGSVLVYYHGIFGASASYSVKGRDGRWSEGFKYCSPADLYETKAEALAAFRTSDAGRARFASRLVEDARP